MTTENQTLTNPQLNQENESQVERKTESPRNIAKVLIFTAGMIGLATVCYLIYLTTRLLFPELASEYLAADLRPQLVTIVAWVMFSVMILFSLLLALRFASSQDDFVPTVLVICFWVACYAWLSLASLHVEQVYYRWAFDSYEYVTFSTRGGNELHMDGEMVRNIIQLPVSILEPNGIRVVMFLVVASFGGYCVWSFLDD